MMKFKMAMFGVLFSKSLLGPIPNLRRAERYMLEELDARNLSVHLRKTDCRNFHSRQAPDLTSEGLATLEEFSRGL